MSIALLEEVVLKAIELQKEEIMKLHEGIDKLENALVEFTNQLLELYEKLNDKEGQNHLILVKLVETIRKDSKTEEEFRELFRDDKGTKESKQYH